MDTIYFLTALYALPIVSFLFFPLRKRIAFGPLHSFFGRIEQLLFIPRDWIAAPVLFSYVFYHLTVIKGGEGDVLIFLPFVALSVFASGMRQVQLKALLDFLASRPSLGPEEFFRLYFSSISGLPGQVMKTSYKKLELPVDYSKGAGGLSFWPVVRGLFWTGVFARLLIRASKENGNSFCQRVAPSVQILWGLTTLKLSRSKLTIDGAKNLEGISGQAVFVSNHKSFLDFSVIPVVIGLLNRDQSHVFKPSYMAAKEHFYDNKFLYSVVGLGRALEAVGTIFVDRKSKKKPARTAVDEAVSAVVSRGVDIVMFPQGTRAHANLNGNRRRVDAGYYTTVNSDRASQHRGHLKKGAAYLAVGAASGLAQKGTGMNLIPVGILGTGITAPREKWRIQKGVEIKVILGRPYLLKEFDGDGLPGDVSRALVENVHSRIDEMLKEVTGIHGSLTRRLTMDVRKMMGDTEMEKFFEAIAAWKSDEDLIFSIIDCIYSLPSRMWPSQFRRLKELIVETDRPKEDLVDFKVAVVKQMVHER